MITLLTVLFVILCFFLATIILLQQGKGDMGLGSMASGQMLFGGSGGQTFFERATWIMGAIFIFGSIGLASLKSKEVRTSPLQVSSKLAHTSKRPITDRLKTVTADMPQRSMTDNTQS